MALAMVDNFLYGYLVVALVLMAAERGGARAIGMLNAALTLGALGSFVVVNRLAGGRRPAPVLAVVLLVFTGAVAMLALAGPSPAGLVLVGIAGAATVVAEVIAVTMLQRATPGEVVARLFGVYDQLNVGALALGSLLAGPLAHWLGSTASLTSVAAACLVGTLLLSPALAGPRRRDSAGPYQRPPVVAGQPGTPP
jgi:MFS family permease